MTPEQFQALHQLMGWHQGSAVADACRLVLVDGITQAEAARATGTQRQNVNRSLAKARQVREAALTLAGARVLSESAATIDKRSSHAGRGQAVAGGDPRCAEGDGCDLSAEERRIARRLAMSGEWQA